MTIQNEMIGRVLAVSPFLVEVDGRTQFRDRKHEAEARRLRYEISRSSLQPIDDAVRTARMCRVRERKWYG